MNNDYAWYKNASYKDLEDEARFVQCNLYDTTGEAPQNMPASKLRWAFEQEYPLHLVKFAGTGEVTDKEAWAQWFLEELAMSEEDSGCENRWDDLKKPETIREAIIIVEDANGDAHLWDGCHRVGSANLNNMLTIPAIVGRLNAGDKIPERQISPFRRGMSEN